MDSPEHFLRELVVRYAVAVIIINVICFCIFVFVVRYVFRINKIVSLLDGIHRNTTQTLNATQKTNSVGVRTEKNWEIISPAISGTDNLGDEKTVQCPSCQFLFRYAKKNLKGNPMCPQCGDKVIECVNCGNVLPYKEEYQGSKLKCKVCSSIVEFV